MPLSSTPRSGFHSDPNKNRSAGLPCIISSFLINLASRGQLSQAVSSLELLSRKGIRLPINILAYLLQECAHTKSLKLGKWVHLHLKLTGLKRPNTFLGNHLIAMYFECGDFMRAYKVFDEMSARNLYSWNHMLSGYAKLGMIKRARGFFDKMPEKDVVSWNTMVIAYAQSGFCSEALRLYGQLRRQGIGYNAYSFAGLVTVCVKLEGIKLSRQAHGQILVAGLLSNVVLSSSVVNAYAKCKEMGDARRLFDEMNARDILAWTTMVSGYALLGDMEAARYIFDMMPQKNPVSWTALISGYARHEPGHKALELFNKMMASHVRPDQFTFSSCLCACASMASLRHGKQIHGYLQRTNFRPNTIVVSSLIDMYSKCGNLKAGKLVFELLGNKQDVVLWNTMISALAQHGLGKEAIQIFDEMVRSRVKPDRVTLLVILNACSHSGLVQEGLRLFESIVHGHGITPDQEHYACLIDLLGRAGCFEDLMNLIDKMPGGPDDQILMALVGICSIHGNIELGSKAAEKLLEFEPQSSAAYVLQSGIYAALGNWESVKKVRWLMSKRHVKKERAVSWIEIENKLHAFTVSDSLHPMKEAIYAVLEQLAGLMEQDLSSYDDER